MATTKKKKKKSAAKEPVQQRINDPALGEVAEIEESVREYLNAKRAETKAKRRAEAAYETVKWEMSDLDLGVYDCYSVKYRVELRRRDDEIKIRELKGDE